MHFQGTFRTVLGILAYFIQYHGFRDDLGRILHEQLQNGELGLGQLYFRACIGRGCAAGVSVKDKPSECDPVWNMFRRGIMGSEADRDAGEKLGRVKR